MPNEDYKQLRRHFDGMDSFMTHGHQIKKIRRRVREAPSWTKSDKRIRELLLRSFPSLDTNVTHRKRAARWARIIHLYHRMGLSQGEVAVEMKTSPKRINDLILHIRRASEGLRTDTHKSRGTRPPGRPKKSGI